jgi:L-asparaginase/Glu-tRNA(Gln) amidotransferase subunit D
MARDAPVAARSNPARRTTVILIGTDEINSVDKATKTEASERKTAMSAGRAGIEFEVWAMCQL